LKKVKKKNEFVFNASLISEKRNFVLLFYFWSTDMCRQFSCAER
jgi:hypothetical protein